MKRTDIEINLKIDTGTMQQACKKASDALKEFGKAIAELEAQRIKVRESEIIKWWQFWKWFTKYCK